MAPVIAVVCNAVRGRDDRMQQYEQYGYGEVQHCLYNVSAV